MKPGKTMILLLGLLFVLTACRPQTAVPEMETTNTESPTPTAGALATVIGSAPPEIKEANSSPDGKWRVEVFRFPCVKTAEGEETAYEALRLVDLSTGEQKTLAEQVLACGGAGAAGLGLVSWSPNSTYLYYSPEAEGVAEGCGNWQRALTAYHLESGDTSSLSVDPASPDGKMMAFWKYDRDSGKSALVLWDLDKGEAGRYEAVEPLWNAGTIAWSPDGAKLAYLMAEQACAPAGETLIVLVETLKKEQKTLVRSEDPRYAKLEWSEPDSITITAADGKKWKYDLGKDELSSQP